MRTYEQILQLKNHPDKQSRGYLFEQAIREIQPWDYKPPISTLGNSEQFDGVYTWKGITFIIESKAKEGEIKRGSHDWEDFELKLTKRIGKGVVGIFCSLYEVNEAVYEAARELNFRNGQVIVLAGDFWNQLSESDLEFSDLLEFMIPQVRLKNDSKPPEIKSIVTWCHDKDEIRRSLEMSSTKFSSTFLRRFKHKYHDQVYVEREVDRYILSCLERLKPSSLQSIDQGKGKDAPFQLVVLRDVSGAGKTTLATHFGGNAGSKSKCISCVTTAKDSILDTSLNKIVTSGGMKRFLLNVRKLNIPLLYVVDSLDEARKDLYAKRQEILGLVNHVKELNEFAKKEVGGLFPILILFTVREDYWRDWENLFEDRRIKRLTKRLAHFTPIEFSEALQNYSSAYNYSISNKLSERDKKTLSQPIVLSIFSESHEFEGAVHVSDVWEEKILHKYFMRKKDDILKHPIPHVNGSVFLKVIAQLAIECIKFKENKLPQSILTSAISRNFPDLKSYLEEMLLMLRSEQIIILDSEDETSYRFRHSKFIEFLCAYYIVSSVASDRNVKILDRATNQVFESGIVSMFNVHDNIRYISRTDFPSTFNFIDEFYASSEEYMGNKVQYLRSSIASGQKTDVHDIGLILKKSSSRNSALNYQCFFVLAAKANGVDTKSLIGAFLLAWNGNVDRPDRWKILSKMKQHRLLMHEKVVSSILNSICPKEWEVFLGGAIETGDRDQLKRMIIEESFRPAHDKEDDWIQVLYLLNVIENDLEFVLGRMI